MNHWSWFWVAIGTLIIMIAPTTKAMFPQIVSGLSMILLGVYFGRKNK